MNILTKAFSSMMSNKSVANTKSGKVRNVPRESEWSGIMMANQWGSNIIENPIVYRCVKLIAQNIASIPIRFESNERFWEKIISRPNIGQKINQLAQQIVSDMLMEGNAYLLNLDNGFYRVDPKCISDLNDEMGNVVGYVYQTKKGASKVLAEPDGRCKVLNIKYLSPTGQKLSPCKVIERSVRLYNSITEYNQALMDNMASFGGALVVKGRLRDEELQVLRQEIDAKKGPQKAGHTAILYGSEDMEVKWEPMRANVRDADYIEGQNFVAREIMQVFGVPPNLLGMSDVAYNNYEQSRFFFWQDTLRPLAMYIYEELQDWLSGIFEMPLKINLDFSTVPAFAGKTLDLLKVLGVDCLSVEERRAFLGL